MKNIERTKEKILEALREETPYSKILKGLVGTFYALSIAKTGIDIMLNTTKNKINKDKDLKK